MIILNVFVLVIQSVLLSALVMYMISFERFHIKYFLLLAQVFLIEGVLMNAYQLRVTVHGYIYFVSIICFAKIFSKSKWQDYMMPALLVLTIITIANLVPACFVIHNHEVSMLNFSKEQHNIIHLVCAILKIILIMLTLRISYSLSHIQTMKVKYNHVFFGVLFLMELLLICLWECSTINVVPKKIVLVAFLMLMSIDILIVYLYYRVHFDNVINYSKNEWLRLLRGYRSQFDEIKDVNHEVRILRHDMKNAMNAIVAYIESNKTAEALNYIEKKYGVVNKIDYLVWSKNPVIDLIVNTKKQEAVLRNINTTVNIQLEQMPNIDEIELCCLLGNALDNAIEHIGKEKVIHLEIKGNELMTKIVIANSVDKSILSENPRLKSTKSEKNHGIGIVSMKEVIKNNNGVIEFSEKAGFFVCTIILIR